MDIDSLVDQVIAREGGYVNHPADRGGPTRYGITQSVARANGYPGDMRRFPRAQAEAIFKRDYWHEPGFDRVATRMPRVAAELFDTGINTGVSVASRFLRRALNALNRGGRDYPDVPATGTVDAALEKALDGFAAKRGAAGEAVLLKAIDALQGEYYIALAESRPANEAFLYGWLTNRVGS